jgi:hypothetical protein
VAAAVVTVISACDASGAQDANTTHPVRISEPSAFAKACGADRRIAFRFGATLLFIAPRWLDFRSQIALSRKFDSSCPNEPIEIATLYFNDSILALAKTPSGMGNPFLFFVIGHFIAVTPNDQIRVVPSDAPPLRQQAEPYVEDITRVSLRDPSPTSSRARVYRLVYPGISGNAPDSVVVSCGGERGRPGGRQCFTPLPYRLGNDIGVRYTFQQNRYPPVDEPQVKGNEMNESKAVLAFDLAIRVWIDSLQAKP